MTRDPQAITSVCPSSRAQAVADWFFSRKYLKEFEHATAGIRQNAAESAKYRRGWPGEEQTGGDIPCEQLMLWFFCVK